MLTKILPLSIALISANAMASESDQKDHNEELRRTSSSLTSDCGLMTDKIATRQVSWADGSPELTPRTTKSRTPLVSGDGDIYEAIIQMRRSGRSLSQ
jgi:hypothetical protein